MNSHITQVISLTLAAMSPHRRIEALILSLVLLIASGAQSFSQDKSKSKDFGSSLRKLKWDPSKKAATQISTEKIDGGDDDIIRVETRLVVADVLVLDGQGHPVVGLSQNDFVVTEDNQPQSITHFSLGDDKTTVRSIVLIIDHSWSQLPYLRTSTKAAETLVDMLGPKDRMAIVSDDVSLVLNFTADKSKLKKALQDLRAITITSRPGILQQEGQAMSRPRFGQSDQFSALFATVRELVSPEDIRPIIIFQSDGDEVNFVQPPNLHRYDKPLAADASDKEKKLWQRSEKILVARVKQYSIDDVYAAVQKARTTVYTVIPGPRFLGLSQSEQFESARRDAAAHGFSTQPKEGLEPYIAFKLDCQTAMARAATISGGWTAFLEDPTQADIIYSRILADINNRYVIGYYPTNKIHDGSRRTVAVAVRNHPDYSVTGRKSYLAPEP